MVGIRTNHVTLRYHLAVLSGLWLCMNEKVKCAQSLLAQKYLINNDSSYPLCKCVTCEYSSLSCNCRGLFAVLTRVVWVIVIPVRISSPHPYLIPIGRIPHYHFKFRSDKKPIVYDESLLSSRLGSGEKGRFGLCIGIFVSSYDMVWWIRFPRVYHPVFFFTVTIPVSAHVSLLFKN